MTRSKTPAHFKGLTYKTKEAARLLSKATADFLQHLMALKASFFPNASLEEVCRFIELDTGISPRELAAMAARHTKAAKKAPKASPKRKKTKRRKRKPDPEGQARAAEGRRIVARGERPPMKEAMTTVMGRRTMGAADIVEGLAKRNWLPTSNDPQQYISYMLSSNKDTFERISRGQYRVRLDAAPKAAAAKTTQVSLTTETLHQRLRAEGVEQFNFEDVARMFSLSGKQKRKINGAITGLRARNLIRKVDSNPSVWALNDEELMPRSATEGRVTANPFALS